MDISVIMRSFTSDNSFLKEAFNLSLKPSNFAPGLIPRGKLSVAPPIFPSDIPVGLSKRTLGFFGSWFFAIEEQGFYGG